MREFAKLTAKQAVLSHQMNENVNRILFSYPEVEGWRDRAEIDKIIAEIHEANAPLWVQFYAATVQ